MKLAIACALVLAGVATASAQYIGNYTINLYAGPPAPPQPPGLFSNPYGDSSNSLRLYNDRGEFRGNLNTNRYDPDSVANPYGRYGSRYSEESINNPCGQGSRYREDSPFNSYGRGLRVYRP